MIFSCLFVMIWTSQTEIPDMEEADGSKYLLEQLHSAVGEGEFIEKIQYEPHEHGDVLMLTGVGEVFPFMRIHALLEALQPAFLGYSDSCYVSGRI